MKAYKFGFAPYAPEIYRMPYAYCYRCAFGFEYPSCEICCVYFSRDFFHTHISGEHVAALIVEPVLDKGGFVVPPKEYFKILYKICQDNGIVFIADEVQTGFGRTARMFAMEHYEVEPDITVMAKSIVAGLPLSAITGRTELMDHPQVGGLGGPMRAIQWPVGQYWLYWTSLKRRISWPRRIRSGEGFWESLLSSILS
jgi:4-aminobutyrate aminotransferase/(S)-3-amino-2-methylpropionate transaminase